MAWSRGCDVRVQKSVMENELLEAELSRSIVTAFFDVYNYFGYGLSERIYAGALAYELRDRGHLVIRELVVDVGRVRNFVCEAIG